MTVKVSICVPAYQSERHLASTVRRCLAQVGTSFEVVVQDNNSTDRTAAVLATFDDPRLRVIHRTTTLPMAENWNSMLEHARGEYVKVVCDDDLIRADAIARQSSVLDADPDVAVVAARRLLIDDSGYLLTTGVGLRGLTGRLEPTEVVRRVVRSGGNPVGEPGSVLFRRADFHAVGGFDGSLLFPMDLDLWIRLLERGAFVGQREALAAFRISRDSLSAAVSDEQYREQFEFTRRLLEDPQWKLTRADRLAWRLAAPAARLRRQVLFDVLSRRRIL